MENSKRSTEEALNGSASLRQRLHRQEGATWAAPIISKQRADSVQPLGSPSAPIDRQLPRYPRRQISNDDLLASIDRFLDDMILGAIFESSSSDLHAIDSLMT